MQTIQKIVIFIMMLSLTACSNSVDTEEKKGEEKMGQQSLQERPYYMIEAEGKNSGIDIYLNGVQVYHDYSTGSYGGQAFVNEFIKDGLNELRIELMGKSRENFRLSSKTTSKVSLTKSLKGQKSVITTLVYKHDAENQTQGTRAEGFYDSNRSYERSNQGDTLISPLELKSYRSFGKDKGIYLEQNITIVEKAFPLWSFLGSEDIADKALKYMSDEMYDKTRYSAKVQKLYKVYGEIHSALKRKDVGFIMALMEERNHEMDLAYFKPKGSTAKEMREDLEEMVNNSKFELLEYIPKNHYTYMDESLKLMYLKTLIYNRKAPEEGSIQYPMIFRYEDEKWILTR